MLQYKDAAFLNVAELQLAILMIVHAVLGSWDLSFNNIWNNTFLIPAVTSVRQFVNF